MLANRSSRGEHFDFAVKRVQRCKVSKVFSPRKGNAKVGVWVRVSATASEVPANPFYAEFIDASGLRYPSTFGGCQPELKVQRLMRGEVAEGWLTFDLPEGLRDGTISYAPYVHGASAVRKVQVPIKIAGDEPAD